MSLFSVRTFRLVLLAGLLSASATGIHAQSLHLEVGPLDLDRLPLTATEASGAESEAALQRVFGHLNVVRSMDDGSLDGIGIFDVPGQLPQNGLILTTRLAENPQPYEELIPRGGTLGPDGLYYFIGSAGDDVSELTLYSVDPESPGAGYTLVSGGVEDGLLAVGTEFPVGLGYDPGTGEAVLVTNLCAEVEGVYYQSFLYAFDLATGVATDRLELRDPNAPTAEDDGVCLFSASWEEGGAIFGADGGGDVVELDAKTGLFAQRYPAVTLPGETIERVQSATYDAERGEHIVFPFSIQREGDDTVAAYTRAFVCTSATGCELRGFVVLNVDGKSFTVEVLTAAVLPKPKLSAGSGAQPGGVALDVYPNPFASSASVALRLDRPEAVTVTVHDLLGRTVAVLFDGQAADLDLALDGSDLPSSVYIVRAQGETFSTVRKVIVTR
jgi:hypothetical protein